jgi:3-oxoacyl-[acyl-carrier-protein] synthase-3
MKGVKSRIIGVGKALPQRAISNDELIQRHNLDSTDQWIFERTGIRQRYICGPAESTSTLALAAAQQALEAAKTAPEEVDLILVATCTPDRTFPSVAMQVQGHLGGKPCPAMDIQAACSGFIYSLAVADSLIKTAQARTALVIGAETFSKLLDWTDRRTCILFGDGAGAVVLQAQEGAAGILGSRLYGDGRHEQLLYADGGVATTGQAGVVQMEGREVFRHAVRAMGQVEESWLAGMGINKEGINWLIPHQANARIIEAAARAAGIPAEKVVMTVDQHANTSAASIPLALAAAVEDGRLCPGDILLLQAFGAGFTWGEMVIKF